MIDLAFREVLHFAQSRVTLCVFHCGCSAWHYDDGRPVRLNLLVLCGRGHDAEPALWPHAPLHPRVGWLDGPPL